MVWPLLPCFILSSVLFIGYNRLCGLLYLLYTILTPVGPSPCRAPLPLCLVNTYSCFISQPKHHLFKEALSDLPKSVS